MPRLSYGWLVWLALVAPSGKAQTSVLRTIGEVGGLSQAEAASGRRVHLRAVATYVDPEWGLLFLEDATGAIFAGTRNTPHNAEVGSLVEIEAVTAAGDLRPVLAPTAIRAIGKQARPVPLSTGLRELDAGQFDARLVEVRGVVRPSSAPWERTVFWIHEGAHAAQVVLLAPDDGLSRQLVDSVVRVRGVHGCRIEAGKCSGPQIFAAGAGDVIVEQPAPKNLEGIPSLALGADFAAAAGRMAHRVKVRGEVTLHYQKELWVESDAGAVPVQLDAEAAVQNGDVVDVAGFPAKTRYGHGLVHPIVRVVRAGPPRSPSASLPADVIGGAMHGRLVKLRGRLIEQSGAILLLDGGTHRFKAMLAGAGPRPSAGLAQGAIVEVAGVAILEASSLSVLVREVSLLPAPNYVSREYVLVLVGLISLAAASALVWMNLLRGTVLRQTGIIRARLEREAQLESEYRRLFERNMAAVFRWRPGGAIVDCNPAFAKMTDYGSREDVLGRCYWEFEVNPAARDELQESLRAGAVANRETCLRRKQGELLWLAQSICLVETSEGPLYEATAIDVTGQRRYREELEAAHGELERRVQERTAELESVIRERMRAEDELKAAKSQAEEMSRAKSEFLANMSHELRTPLNAVIGYSEILTEDLTAARQLDLLPDLDRIQQAARHLLRLINDVLDLSKIEAGRMEICQEAFPVADMVEDVIATMEPMARKTRNRMAADFSKAPAVQVADPTRFRQSLLNLLANACKFTDGGEVNLTVERVSGNGAEWVEWAVTDNGIGIPPEHQAKLFQSFTQVDAASTRKFSGTGLGLVISKHYCRMMGGDITFSSEPGRGSRFVIRLPGATAQK